MAEFGSKEATIHQFQSLDKKFRDNLKLLDVAMDPEGSGAHLEKVAFGC